MPPKGTSKSAPVKGKGAGKKPAVANSPKKEETPPPSHGEDTPNSSATPNLAETTAAECKNSPYPDWWNPDDKWWERELSVELSPRKDPNVSVTDTPSVAAPPESTSTETVTAAATAEPRPKRARRSLKW